MSNSRYIQFVPNVVIRCDEVRRKVQELKTGDYAMAKASVDKLRQELGMEEIKSIEMQLEEKK